MDISISMFRAKNMVERVLSASENLLREYLSRKQLKVKPKLFV